LAGWQAAIASPATASGMERKRIGPDERREESPLGTRDS